MRSCDWGKHFQLTADLNVIDVAMTRIGTNSKKFTGTFDGDGNTITNLMIDLPTTNFVGLFGVVDSAFDPTIFNLGLINPDITGDNNVGALVGQLDNGALSACTADGGSVNGDQGVGGLVGINYGMISDSYGTVSVSGTDNYVGGLVGYNNTGTISDSYATGSVTGINSTPSGSIVGGLVGRNGGVSTINNCYATGSITGTSLAFSSQSIVGGLVGSNGGTISDSYATGSITGAVTTGTGSNLNIGGLVGLNISTVSNSFWDTETSGQPTSDGGTGKTTAQMKQQATFTGWDFADTWGIFENQTYPLLKAILLCIQDGTGYPPGDSNRDCLYNILDFVFSAQFWLADRNW
ncbi:MAG: hypothetical protein IID32_06660 [Planctomycetes bacterium]|nr:hypothetical protein [Planctomycetota bacterium]